MSIGLVENAIIARLDAASKGRVLGYSLRTIETLPTDLDDRLATYIQNFPAVWVAFGGWPSATTLGDGEAVVTASFNVIVGASSLRNERAQRHGGGPGEVGSYQMAMDVIALLQGQDFGLPIGELTLGACTPLYSGQTQDKRKASIFGIKFTTQMSIAPVTPDEITTPTIGDFKTFAVGWDIPPRTGQADLSDEIHPPQDS